MQSPSGKNKQTDHEPLEDVPRGDRRLGDVPGVQGELGQELEQARLPVGVLHLAQLWQHPAAEVLEELGPAHLRRDVLGGLVGAVGELVDHLRVGGVEGALVLEAGQAGRDLQKLGLASHLPGKIEGRAKSRLYNFYNNKNKK